MARSHKKELAFMGQLRIANCCCVVHMLKITGHPVAASRPKLGYSAPWTRNSKQGEGGNGGRGHSPLH